ncbi:cytochrome P450 711A1 [Brachypodium distachyon]|uniref:Uncharacterized protein n=1 Tax=Brachypodium distachyon TaxID=15368 RepID=I1IIZ7_BRADI|nr:cytochrome P450 711A1 [Brachypodium distachyon]KQJ87011.1 hypothetical protein BRADI_4g08970v3 [Brachypodium distachyon]|eukprot:XP_003575594.2 cytochrome P450 711A1 [Brachypodium distachyon]
MGMLPMLLGEYAVTVVAMAVGFLVATYLYEPYWKMRHVPGPVPLPLIGNLHLLAWHGPDVFSVLARKHGPVFRFHMGRQALIMVADAELCRQVGIRKFKSFRNRSLPSPIAKSPILEKGLFVTRDSRWSAMRNTVASIYQPSHLASLVPTMHSYIQRAARNIGGVGGGQDVDFSTLAVSLFTDVMGQAAFGLDFGLTAADKNPGGDSSSNKQAQEFVKMHAHVTTSLKMDMTGSLSSIVGQLVPSLHRPFQEVLRRVPGTADRETDRVNRELRRQMDAIVADAARERDLHYSRQQQKKNDFLSVVLGGAAEKLLTPDYIGALAYEHILAGSASPAFTLSTVVYLVSKHPEVEDRLLKEVDAFFLDHDDRLPTADDLHTNFPYLDQVVKESMRFYMSSPLVARESSDKVDIGGYVLPKGTWVWLAPGVLAKDPINFPDPELFRPERFDPTGDEDKRRHPYAFIPFGIGPRICIGYKFSIQEIKLAIIHLYRQYIFRHSPSMESPLQFQYGVIVNFKHGVKLQVIHRHKE